MAYKILSFLESFVPKIGFYVEKMTVIEQMRLEWLWRRQPLVSSTLSTSSVQQTLIKICPRVRNGSNLC